MFVTLTCDLAYPNNSHSNFSCLLDEPIVLSGRFEVALTEISYPVDYLSKEPITVTLPDFLVLDNENLIAHFKDKNGEYSEYDEEQYLDNNVRAKNRKEFDKMEKNLKNKIKECLDSNIDVKQCLSGMADSFNPFFSLIEETQWFALRFSMIRPIDENVRWQNKVNVEVQLLLNDLITRQQNELRFGDDEMGTFIKMKNSLEELENVSYHLIKPINPIQLELIANIRDRASVQDKRSDVFIQFPNFFFTEEDHLQIKRDIEINYKGSLFSINKANELRIKDLGAVIKHFYIATDIISDNFVLNRNAPILKIVKTEGVYGDVITHEYENPHYSLVNKTYINKIKIQIFDVNHNLVEFNSGPVIVKLQFRKAKK